MTASDSQDAGTADVYHRLGVLTRTLHDSLRQLGYDKQLEAAASNLPDARTRLAYVSKLTGDAAERVLNAVDRATQDQSRLADLADEIERELKAHPALAVASGKVLRFIEDARATAGRTNGELTEIMMAQDFHDLTGQVIGKVVTLAHDLESQLVKLLLDAAPRAVPEPVGAEAQAAEGWLNGPPMRREERTDVVQNQAQVDDLLESLGF